MTDGTRAPLEIRNGRYYVDCRKISAYIKVKNNVIIEAPPLLRKFIGQQYLNLIKWFSKFGDVKDKRIGD